MRRTALAAVFLIGWYATASAQSTYDNPRTPEGWAWAKIRNDETADFAERCGKDLDAHNEAGWDDPCRQISAQFLADLLTAPKWRDKLARQRVRLRGARIDGTIDLGGTEITPELSIYASRIEGRLVLNDSHWNRLLSVRDSIVTGGISGYRMVSESSIYLRDHIEVKQEVDLLGAKIGGELDMSGSSFAGLVRLGYITIAGNFLMNKGAKFGAEVNLNGAKASYLDMSGSSFAGPVYLGGSTIAANLLMNKGAKFDAEVNLNGAKAAYLDMGGSSFAGPVYLGETTIAGSLLMNQGVKFGAEVNLNGAKASFLDMAGSSFAGPVTLSGTTIAGNLFMHNGAKFAGTVDIIGANVGGNLEMFNSSFQGEVDLFSIRVAGNLPAHRATFERGLKLRFSKIVGILYLDGATAASIDLSGSDFGEFDLIGLEWWCADRKAPSGVAAKPAGEVLPMHWALGDPSWRDVRCGAGTPPELVLRNAHVVAFQDSSDAWPPVMNLEGFRYDRLGGSLGGGRDDMRKHSPEEWKDWLARDPTFSTQPYTQLSSVLAAAGHRETSEEIQFAGRERERKETNSWGSWTWLTFLSAVAGYGIGLYTFRVVWWVLLLTVLGAVLLQLSPAARVHGVMWRCGASLHRLLPVVELSKEFTDFFDNLPAQTDMPRATHGFLQIYFAGHALAGYVLGFFLIAAMSGLTQKA